MAFQPIHRRYGYGAARLPLGVPAESLRLSECAQRRSDHERLFAVLPGLFCAGLAVLLGLASSLDLGDHAVDLATVEPTTIDFEPWDSPPRITDPPPPATIQPHELEAKPEDLVAERTAVPEEIERAAQPPREFDVALLAMAPSQALPIAPPTDVRTSAQAEQARPDERRPKGLATPPRIAVEPLAMALPTSASVVAPASRADERVAASASSLAQRPGSASDSSAPSDVKAWTPGSARSDFLAALGEGESSPAASSEPPASGAARPHVAAAAAIAVGRDVRDSIRQQALLDGWHEIPLDELPACSPPERQDELKKRILLAAAAQRARECSHPDGQYRFLETRNLNAFLMWSRTNPESASSQRPARDVCDVLMRALACLAGASNTNLGVE